MTEEITESLDWLKTTKDEINKQTHSTEGKNPGTDGFNGYFAIRHLNKN